MIKLFFGGVDAGMGNYPYTPRFLAIEAPFTPSLDYSNGKGEVWERLLLKRK